MPGFDKGSERAEGRAKAARSFGGRVPFLIVKEDDPQPTFIRMITDLDDWIPIGVHISVPTKEKPKDIEGDWPKALSFVCQNEPAFRLRDDEGKLIEPPQWEKGYGHCYIHEKMGDQLDNYKRPRSNTAEQVYALCVVRKVVKEGGKIKGFADATVEWKDKDGKTYTVPDFRLVVQKWSNFFGPLNSSAFLTGSVTGRDFIIKRTGRTDYDITAADNTPDHHGPTKDKPASDSWARYTDALKMMDVDLERIVTDASSPDFYGRFLDPAVEVKPRKKDDKAGDSDETADSAPAASSDEPTDEEIEQFRAGLMENAATGSPADGSP